MWMERLEGITCRLHFLRDISPENQQSAISVGTIGTFVQGVHGVWRKGQRRKGRGQKIDSGSALGTGQMRN